MLETIAILCLVYFGLWYIGTVFENPQKCRIQHYELRIYGYILSGQKFIKNAKNSHFLASFWKSEACGQTALPDRSLLIGQKLVENGKIENFK